MAAEEFREAYQDELRRCKKKELCEKLSAALESGSVAALKEMPDSTSSAIVTRIADKTLSVEDLSSTNQQLPCAEFSSSKAIWQVFVDAAAVSAAAWGNVSSVNLVPAELSKALSGRDKPLSKESAEALRERVAEVAEQAARRGTSTSDLDDARRLCELETQLGSDSDPSCKTVSKRWSEFEAKEARAAERVAKRAAARAKALEAAEKRAEAAEKRAEAAREAAAEAKRKRCDNIRWRALECDMKCMEGDLFFNESAFEACQRRCTAMLKAARCED